MGIVTKLGNYRKKFSSKVENRELLIDSITAFFIRILAAIASFLMNMVVARKLGAYNSGSFFLCFAVITVIAVVVRLGGDNLLLRYVGIYAPEKKWNSLKLIVKVIGTRAFICSVIVAGLLVACNGLIAEYIFHKQDIAGTLFWMMLSMPLLALYTLMSYAFQGLKKVLFSVSIQNIMVPALLVVFILIVKPANSVEVAKLYFASSALTVLFTLFFWYKVTPRHAHQNEEARLPDGLWRSSYYLWVFAIFQIASQWGGQFIAGIYCQQKDLAQLAVAQRISWLITFILIAVNLVSAPKFANLYKQGKMENLKKYALLSTKLMVAFASPIVLFMIIFPKFLLGFFGAGFTTGAPMLIVLALGQFINVLTGSVTLLLMMSGHERDMRNIQFSVGIFCVVLTFILVKTNGVFGAALATAICVATQNLICVGVVKKRLGFSTLNIWSR